MWSRRPILAHELLHTRCERLVEGVFRRFDRPREHLRQRGRLIAGSECLVAAIKSSDPLEGETAVFSKRKAEDLCFERRIVFVVPRDKSLRYKYLTSLGGSEGDYPGYPSRTYGVQCTHLCFLLVPHAPPEK